MRKHAKVMSKNTSTRTRRFHVICVVGIVIVFAIAATAISMQAGKGESESGEKSNPQAGSNSRGHALPLRAAEDGQVPSKDQIRPLTQEEAQRMAEGLKKLVNQSSEGLQQVQHADGSVSMDLQGRFQSVILAKKTDDGRVVQSCVDNPRSAAAFLGIDRELIDGTKTTSPANTREGGQNQ